MFSWKRAISESDRVCESGEVVDGQRSCGTTVSSVSRGLRLGNEMRDVQQSVVLFLMHTRRMCQDGTHSTSRSIGISWPEKWLDGRSNSIVASPA